jgi:hypothetical protein
MEYQPLIVKHNEVLPEPYLNEGGAFLTLPSQTQVMEFLLEEAKGYITYKDGGEAAEKSIIYPSDYEPSNEDSEGHIILEREDGHGYTVNLNTLDKGWTYDSIKTETICHFLYIANSRKITIPQSNNNIEKNTLIGNYDTLIEELKKFDISNLKSIKSEEDSEENISSSSYDSDSDWEWSSSDYDCNDLEMNRIPTPPPIPSCPRSP